MLKNNDLFNQIYMTIDDKEKWNFVLKKIANFCLGCEGGGASIIPLEENMINFRFGSSDNKEADFLYYQYWKGKSPIYNDIKNNLDKDFLFVNDSHFSEEEINKNPYYQEFLRKFGVKRTSNIIFKTNSGSKFIFSIQSPWDYTQEDPKKIEKNMVSLFNPINNSLDIGMKFFELKNKQNAFEKILADIYNIVLFLDKDNRVVHEIKNYSDINDYGFYIKNRMIILNNPSENKNFRNLLSTMQDCKKELFFKFSNNDKNIISMKITSLMNNVFFMENIFTANKVIIFSIDSVNKNTETALRDFSLSPSQAKLACLITNGLSIKEASIKMNIAEGTARQMVKEIFFRLGINSQNKLVSFVKNVSSIS